jgi:hypothetical protein
MGVTAITTSANKNSICEDENRAFDIPQVLPKKKKGSICEEARTAGLKHIKL